MRQPFKLAIAFVVLYLLAVCTPYGQSVENRPGGFASETWVFHILYSVGPPPLRFEGPIFVIGVILIVGVAVLRRQWWLAVAGAFVPVATAAASYLLNRMILPRPDISNAPESLMEVSFPSGHVAVTAGVAAGAILVSTPRARPYVAAAGVLWLAFVAAAVQNLGWHRPSDAIGATLLACIAYLVAAHLLPAATRPATQVRTTPVLGLVPALAIAAVGATLGAGRTGYIPEAVVTAIVGVLCAVILWSTVQRGVRNSSGIVVAVVLVLAIVSAVGVDYWRKHSEVNLDSGRPEPAVITGPGTAGKGVTVGKRGADTNIDFYLAFSCRPCAEFEKATGSTLDPLLENGTVTVTYWPVVSGDSDQRLATLFAAAAANGKASGFLHAVYGDSEKAWTDDQLAELGDKLGLPKDTFATALRTNSYGNWFKSIDETTVERQITELPAVLVNGKKLLGDQVTVDNLKSALG
ncbi:thioredoxin domain-containing protein [Streptomyces sp. SID13031]|uniref:thioredoxin domain-containing protein n=1 Tax=Streptomyces sp. SID13031 TaxID=2706046 RepID=UPI0013CA48CE|nr:thioredoxin domain-containing protein [Streptomyces sp. SID13031]NEA36615.1 thioredoxin domain-containing protein [Streptomyces sp. SID13031]